MSQVGTDEGPCKSGVTSNRLTLRLDGTTCAPDIPCTTADSSEAPGVPGIERVDFSRVSGPCVPLAERHSVMCSVTESEIEISAAAS